MPKTTGITVLVNGEERRFEAPMTLLGLLEVVRVRGSRFAVERNKRVVPKARLGETRLEDGDVIEIVTLVGGG
jgi:thiamine biosynthesis protein ThiS